MYTITLNGHLLLDGWGRPEHFDRQNKAEEKAEKLRTEHPRCEVKVIKRMVSLNQVS